MTLCFLFVKMALEFRLLLPDLTTSLKLIKGDVNSLNINPYPLGALYIYVNTMFTYIPEDTVLYVTL